jgi:Cytochrome c3
MGLLFMMRLIQLLLLFSIYISVTTQAVAAVQPVVVCVQCHAVLSGKFSAPVKLWQKSIHAEHGVTCNACHGGDPMDSAQSMSPARGFRGVPVPTAIPVLCGGCHMGIVNRYMNSAHGRALGKGGPSCVTCHGSHGIIRASLDLINVKNCTPCHTFDKARQIRSAMMKTDVMLKAIEDKIKVLKSQGIDTDPLEKRLFSLRNRSHSMFHSLDVKLIRQESAHILAELKKTNGVGGVGTGHLVGVIAIAGALLAALLFFLIKKNLD